MVQSGKGEGQGLRENWGAKMHSCCWSTQHEKIQVDEYKIYITVLTGQTKECKFSGALESDLCPSSFVTGSFSPL
jgi:hypothetical protein